jgi:hypothetical protein
MMLLGVVEGDHALEVGSGRCVFSETQQDASHIAVAERYMERIVGALG